MLALRRTNKTTTEALIFATAFVLSGLTACGDDGHPGAPPPTGTLEPTPTPTPTASLPMNAITYRLTEGSTILSSPAPAGINSPTLEEPLSGTLVVVPLARGAPSCLNAIFCFSIVAFQFQSSHFTISGSDGYIDQTTFQPDRINLGLTASINDEVIFLNGGGPFGWFYPPPLNGSEICGAPLGVGGSCVGIRAGTDVGYHLILFGVPAN
jgi:hypothetical protein